MTERFTFAGMRVSSRAEVIDGTAVMMVELCPEGTGAEDMPLTTIAWTLGFDRFGIYANSDLITHEGEDEDEVEPGTSSGPAPEADASSPSG